MVINACGCGKKTNGLKDAPSASLEAPADTELPLDRANEAASTTSIAAADVEPAPPLLGASTLDESSDTTVERSRQALLEALSAQLRQDALQTQTPMRELAMLAAISIIDPQRQVDPRSVEQLNTGDRQVLARLQEFFARISESLASRGGMEQSIEQAASKLAASLHQSPQLKLANAVLCTRVGGFGDYTPFERAVFLAGSPQKVILYLEVENFTSELNQRGEYTTELSQQLAITDERDGSVLWKEQWQNAVDVSRKKRQDYFTVQTLTLPNSLAVGHYQLQVRLRDEQTGQQTQTAIPFEIVDDPKLAVTVK